MREGKLFRMDFDPDQGAAPGLSSDRKPVRKVEHFWLCGRCASTLTLVMNAGKVETVPVFAPAFKAAAAS